MAGFGGLFDYETPGPGVNKNDPKKKGFRLFLSILIEKFWKLIPLSLLYWLLCIPLVTIGLADVGMTYITRNFAREKPVILVADYFSTIKKNWKQALPVGIINLLLSAILIFAIWFYYAAWGVPENSEFQIFLVIGFVVAACMFIVFTFLKYYINILIVTFNLNIKQLYKNSLLLSSAGLKANLIITGMLVLLYAIIFGLPLLIVVAFGEAVFTIIFLVVAILFLPAMRALIIQFFVFPVVKKHMIDPYYEQHPEAKKDKELLNIADDDDETETDDDVIFKDIGSEETAVSKEESTIPKQYSKRDIKRIRRQRDRDDDDTI